MKRAGVRWRPWEKYRSALYYGTVDATPLFVMLAGAYFENTHDLDFIRSIWPNIDLALEWIDRYGDKDDDGFIEYARLSAKGLIQQGWKDSWDSVSHKDGSSRRRAHRSLRSSRLCLCRQTRRRGDVALALGQVEKSQALLIQAEKLKEQFSQAILE